MSARRAAYQPETNTHLAVARLAVRQHGVFTASQLLKLGVSRSASRQRVAAGTLFSIHRGVLALVPAELLSRDGRYLAAVLACGPGAVISHRSAGALHGIRASARSRIEVTVPFGRNRCPTGVQTHRSRTLDPDRDVTVVRGIPVTTVARTLLDLCEVIAPRAVERALDQADVIQQLDLAQVLDQLARNHGRHRAAVLARLIDAHHGPDTLTVNQLEERMLSIIRDAGLPSPEVNALIALPEGEPIYGDFVWRAQRLIVETDGRRSHGTAHAFESDRVRDQRAMLAGWRVVRFSRRQVAREPGRVAATIAALLKPAAEP